MRFTPALLCMAETRDLEREASTRLSASGICLLSVCVYERRACTHVWAPLACTALRPEGSSGALGIGVTDGFELTCGCCESRPALLGEQPLSPTEPPPSPILSEILTENTPGGHT